MKSKIKALGLERLGPAIAERQPRRTDLPLETWGLAATPTAFTCDGVDLHELTRRFGSPLHVVRSAGLDERITEALAPLRAGAGADVFYSYKTNPVPAVLRQLHAGGIGAEVISEYEFWLARELGVLGERIIYNGPAKSPESIAEAIRVDTYLINANSLADLGSIIEQARTVAKPANLGIRVALDGMWAGQFGLDENSEELRRMVREASDSPHVELKALHFHRGSTMRHIDEVRGHVQIILDFADRLRAETGWHPEILDIGGSLACATSASIPQTQFRLNRALGTDTLAPDPTDCALIGEVSAEAWKLVDRHFSTQDLEAPQVILEPGRALTADSQFLLTTVLDVKGDGSLPHVVLDAGVNIAESVTNEYHQLFNVSNFDGPAESSYRLVGPICTPADVLYNNWRMPEPQVGHLLAIMDTGAYCVPFSTSFSFPRPAIVLIGTGPSGPVATLMRRAETFLDLVARDSTAAPTNEAPDTP